MLNKFIAKSNDRRNTHLNPHQVVRIDNISKLHCQKLFMHAYDMHYCLQTKIKPVPKQQQQNKKSLCLASRQASIFTSIADTD